MDTRCCIPQIIATDIFFQILTNLLKINIPEKVFFALLLSSQTSPEVGGYLTQYFSKAIVLEFEKHIHITYLNELGEADLPSIVIEPLVGFSKSAITRNNVVLPQPLGPIKGNKITSVNF
jgi:hypothetical protein